MAKWKVIALGKYDKITFQLLACEMKNNILCVSFLWKFPDSEELPQTTLLHIKRNPSAFFFPHQRKQTNHMLTILFLRLFYPIKYASIWSTRTMRKIWIVSSVGFQIVVSLSLFWEFCAFATRNWNARTVFVQAHLFFNSFASSIGCFTCTFSLYCVHSRHFTSWIVLFRGCTAHQMQAREGTL